MAEGKAPKYDRKCYGIKEPVAGRTPVLRFHSTDEGETVVRDMVRGAVTFENKQLDDLIIMRSDGFPTYNFCCGRGRRDHEDLPCGPRRRPPQQYAAPDPDLPRVGIRSAPVAHLPMILGSTRRSCPKRHGATAVTEYKDLGYLPEALMNYLARLGWSSGDQEVFSIAELIEKFTLDNIGKAPAVFNPEKLVWLNHHYIQQADHGRLAGLVLDS